MNADLPEVTLAYIAGFLDGEGTISIRRGARGRTLAGLEMYDCIVIIAQKKREVLDWIREVTGVGHISAKHQKNNSFAVDGDITVFNWTCGAKAAYEFTVAILPYLRIKRRQAEVMIEFHEYKKSFVRRVPGYRGTLPTPEARMDKYREYCETIQRLNGRKAPMTGLRGPSRRFADITAIGPLQCSACKQDFLPDTYFSENQLKNEAHYCKPCRESGDAAKDASRRSNERERAALAARKAQPTE